MTQQPSREWLQALSMGAVAGFSAFVVQGTNPDVDTGSVPEDLRPAGGTYVFPTAAVALEALSDSANDAAAGTGAHTIRVVGLNLALAVVTEDVTLNGLTPVALVNTYYRVNLVQVLTAGSYETNFGTVTVRTVVGANGLHAIPPDFGRGQTGVYTVPANTVAWLIDGLFTQLNLSGNAYCGHRLVIRSSPAAAWLSRAFITTGDGCPTVALQPRLMTPVTAGSDIKLRATIVGTNNTSVTSSVSLILQSLV
jgi:hypothetical protein